MTKRKSASTEKKSSTPRKSRSTSKSSGSRSKSTSGSNSRGGTGKRTRRKSSAETKAEPKKKPTTKRSARKPSTKSRNPSPPPPEPSFALSRHQKGLIAGISLIFLTMILGLSLISPSQGTLTSMLSDWLGTMFGIGKPVVPLALGATGFYLVLWGMEQPPKLNYWRLAGLTIFFLAFQAIATSIVVQRSNPFTDVRQIADLQMGGGYIGGFFSWLLTSAVGPVGSMFLLVLLALIGIIMVSGVSRETIGAWINNVVERTEQPRIRERQEPSIPSNPAPILDTPRTRATLEFDPEPVEEAEDPAEREARKIEDIRERRRAMIRERTPDSKHPQSPRRAAKKTKRTAETPEPAIVSEAGEWKLPAVDEYLERGLSPESAEDKLQEQWYVIEHTLESFGAPGKIVDVNPGPTVTQFGVEPQYVESRSGRRTKVKVSKIAGLADDLALALAAKSVRIEAPVPGKGYIGIEVPNPAKVVVSLRDIMESASFQRIKSHLRIGIGQDVAGNPISADLAKMPHLLIAGATGSGKSVCVNSIIAGLLLERTPDELRFVMVDPKRVELTGYNGIPHLAAPVVVDMDKVVGVLQWALREMDSRYTAFAGMGARNIKSYNEKAEALGKDKLPYIVIIIDELADLMMTAPEDTERALARLAQMARATGIHMIIATQRPSVDVVTGLIKANFPARIAFAVSSSTDSRVILDTVGAERLLGQGDMLFQKPDAPAPMRMQGCYVSDEELNKLIAYWKTARRFHRYTVDDAEPKNRRKTAESKTSSTANGRKVRQPVRGKPAVEPPIELRDRAPVLPKRDDGRHSRIIEPKPQRVQPEPATPEPAVTPKAAPKRKRTPKKKPPEPVREQAPEPEYAPDSDLDSQFQQPLWEHLVEEEKRKQTESVDELWDEAVAFVRESGKASTSMLQRRFRIGYTRAARIIDAMEDAEIIGPPTGTSKAREVLPPE